MVKVLQQDRSHPLFGVLNQHLDMQRGITDTTVRSRPKTRSDMPYSVLNELGRNLFAHCVELWYSMAEESRQWYRDNAPPQFCTGFLWWTWSCLIKNYNAGPWTVNVSSVGGHCYICPQEAPEGIFAKGYVDATEIGTLAHLDWDPACREEGLPLLLVHGWYPDAFDPAETWRVMAQILTGKDAMQPADFTYIYDPDRPGDENYALKFLTGQGLDVYISNYTHEPESGTPGDIRRYAHSLAHEIEIVRSHKGAPAVDILSHSMGGIVARAYIENEDFSPNPYPAPYRDDVFNLIMLAPPNQGTKWSNLYPGWWDWLTVLQLESDSDFLAQLNSGVTGKSKGVTYHIIAGNKYDCEQWILGPCPQGSALCIMWKGELVLPSFQTYPPNAYRLCAVTNEEPNDSEITVAQTMLYDQDGVKEVDPQNFHVRSFDHWEMRGQWNSPCDAATLVKIILAGYSLAKWRAKGKDIEPPEANYIQRCFNLIERTDACRAIYDHIVDTNITVEFRDLPTGTVAQWVPDDNTIAVDISAEALDEKVTSQYIIHEGEHSRWHGEDSISQEWHAYKAEADFWNAVKKGDHDGHCDWVAGFIAQGRHAAMDYIRALPAYDGWSEYSGVNSDLTEAFRALEDRPTGYYVCLNAQRMGAEFDPQVNAGGMFAWYWYEYRRGAIDETWQDDPIHATVAALAFLGVHAWWSEPLSIHQLWHAYWYMGKVWNTIKGDLEHEFLDFVDSLFPQTMPTNSAAMEPEKVWIRGFPQYADLPEFWPPGAAQPPRPIRPSGPGDGGPGGVPGGKININTAGQAELETLPAIGPSRAQGIIEYRPYETIEDIQTVPGIGPLTFLKIKDLITVV